MTLGNVPLAHTLLRLGARQSYALGIKFLNRKDGSPVDITGATITMRARKPKRWGSTTAFEIVAVPIGDMVLGHAQFDMQAETLDLEPASYSFTVTLKSVNDYSTPALMGTIEIVDNDNDDAEGTFPTLSPNTQLAAYMENGDVVEVQIDKVDGPTSVVSLMLSQADDMLTAAQAAADAAGDSASAAGASQLAAAGSVSAAAASAATATTKAQEAADSETGAEGAATQAGISAAAAAQSASQAVGAASLSESSAIAAREAADRSEAASQDAQDVRTTIENGDFSLTGYWDFTDADVVGIPGGGGGGGLVEDPSDPGTYLPSGGGGGLVEDPSDPGTYLIGA